MELVDTLDLGSSAAMCEGSSPFTRTEKSRLLVGFFYGLFPASEKSPALFHRFSAESNLCHIPHLKQLLSERTPEK